MKKSFFTLLFLVCIAAIQAQDFYVTRNKDTTFCESIEFSTNARGFISELSYTDIHARKIVLKKHKNIPDIVFMRITGVSYVSMPLKTKKPNSYYRVGHRIVDGKLKVSRYDDRITRQVYRPADKYHPTGGYRNVTSGTYLFQLTLPDGTIIKINKRKNMKKIIIPYLQSCIEFKSAYNGNYNSAEQTVIRMIEMYNALCR